MSSGTAETARFPGGFALRILASLILLVPCSCVSRVPGAPVDWTSGEVVTYRLVTKKDFGARTSNSAGGNFAHGAEICTNIVPAEDYERGGGFRAVMRPDCSFWNKAIGPLGLLGRAAGFILGFPVIVPVKQSDEYILQHEQIHFAIMEVAARRLSSQVAGLSGSSRSSRAIQRAYSMTLSRARGRHGEFDAETSGTFRQDALEKWVRVLEIEMGELCGRGVGCQVRTSDP